ncbi:MAG: hypothetical protein DWQ34_26360 [Planctomycetota bacterium]|nr:MAG: hypothetical protein DWQ34_26360 [Planctomycetota bacterium]REK22748.1 MAG: hypothetical protein DWQ41_18265 [Planctomycetota bacterium]REK33832.1 MAG: hypothetical protein DWQ45_14725 [Planctomycetota bacterium]
MARTILLIAGFTCALAGSNSGWAEGIGDARPTTNTDLLRKPLCTVRGADDLLQQVVRQLTLPFAVPACGDRSVASEPLQVDLLMPQEQFPLDPGPVPPPTIIRRVRVDEASPNLPPHISVTADNIQYVPGPPPILSHPPLPPRPQPPQQPSVGAFRGDVQYLPIPSTLRPLEPTPDVCPAAPQRSVDLSSNHEAVAARVQHLREAARHLEAAGHADAAAIFREEADGLLSASIKELNLKRQQLRQLQAEVAELERATGQSQHVLLRCRCVELNLDAAKRSGLEGASFFQRSHRSSGIVTLLRTENARTASPTDMYTNEEIDAAVNSLTANGVAKITSDAKLITIDGKPAGFLRGGQLCIPVSGGDGQQTADTREYGLKFNAVPHIISGKEVRLELSLENSERDFQHTAESQGRTIPGLNTSRVQTRIDVEFGRSLVMSYCGPEPPPVQTTSGDDTDQEPQTMFLLIVTPELYDAHSTRVDQASHPDDFDFQPASE